MQKVATNHVRGDGWLHRVGDNRESALFVDGSGGFSERELLRDRLGYPKGEDVTIGAGHFDAGDNLEGITILVVISPQTSVETVVIGNGDHVECGVLGDMIEQLMNGCQPITRRRMHV